MKTKILNDTFSFLSPINRDNGFVNINLVKKAKSTISVTVTEDGRGFFEWEVPSIGAYETGGLWFSGNDLVDYDGLFELPMELIKFLEQHGYNADHAK